MRRASPPPSLPHLFGAAGLAELDALWRRRPLLAFDFDGTLTPIVARPDDVQLAEGVAADLRWLAQRTPLAVISGRSVADLRPRLGFEPTYLVGCHGADDATDPARAQAWTQPLRAWRQGLDARAAELQAAGVEVEDKGAAIALHHRRARDPARALALLDALLGALPPALRGFGGKQVVNVVAAAAPDKADALLALVSGSGAGTALFAGDDVNDEPVFQRAPPGWLTVRVGVPEAPTRARFGVHGPHEVATLLRRLVRTWTSAPND
jgi:trehalose 6-phosphate phosphatase